MLLDGQYKVLTEKVLDSQITFFKALTPEKFSVFLLWYNLNSPEEENAFESYRKLLRDLKRKNLAAIYNIVSRPGAHYVVWYKPPDSSKRLKKTKSTEKLKEIFEKYQQPISRAHIYKDVDGIRVYMLPLSFPAAVNDNNSKIVSIAHTPQLTTLLDKHTDSATPKLLIRLIRTVLSPNLLTVIMLGLGVLLLVLSFRNYVNVPVLQIPQVVGQPIEKVAPRLHDLGFKVQLKAIPSDEMMDKVLEVIPPEASYLRKGKSVMLHYGFPKNYLPVKQPPDLHGFKDIAVVKDLLAENGLELGKVLYVFTDIEKDTVIAQSHLAEEVLVEGGSIDVVVSKGSLGNYSYMPDLTDLPLEEARSLIRLVGLNSPVEIEWRANTNLPPTTVIAQNIAPELLIDLQIATLRLVVAGEDTFSKAAPNFIGMSIAQAEKLARQRNLVLDIKEISTLNLLTGVVAQDPNPNQALEGVLAITVNTPPEINEEIAQETVKRFIPYSWPVEFGIPQQLAEVTVETSEGQHIVIDKRYVKGGEEIFGIYETDYVGKLTFHLTLNNFTYSTPLVVEPTNE